MIIVNDIDWKYFSRDLEQIDWKIFKVVAKDSWIDRGGCNDDFQGQVDILSCNPPYISSKKVPEMAEEISEDIHKELTGVSNFMPSNQSIDGIFIKPCLLYFLRALLQSTIQSIPITIGKSYPVQVQGLE